MAAFISSPVRKQTLQRGRAFFATAAVGKMPASSMLWEALSGSAVSRATEAS